MFTTNVDFGNGLHFDKSLLMSIFNVEMILNYFIFSEVVKCLVKCYLVLWYFLLWNCVL